MKFHHKIILLALSFSMLVAGAQALPGADGAQDLADPGYWVALGEGLIGIGENGWSTGS